MQTLATTEKPLTVTKIFSWTLFNLLECYLMLEGIILENWNYDTGP